jgi:hypothetical protein
MASIAAITTGIGGVVTTADNSGVLNLQSGTTTIVSITAAGAAVTGTLSASGATTFPAGSAAAPAITTTGNTNTGIFFPAADTIAFSEGGVESMRIDSSGRLGIGTASPTVPLDVTGSNTAGSVEGAFTNTSAGSAASAGVRAIANSTGYWLLRQYGTGVGAIGFGQTLANYAALFSDGASSNGLLVGSLTA